MRSGTIRPLLTKMKKLLKESIAAAVEGNKATENPEKPEAPRSNFEKLFY